MSLMQEDFGSPSRSTLGRNRRNRIGSPLSQTSKNRNATTQNVYELFTVKRLDKSESQDSSISEDIIQAKSTSTTTKSDTRSYKDKINERFKNVKEKAGKSTKKAHIFNEVTERILLEKIKRENSDIDAKLERIKNKLQFGQKLEHNEIYEFFAIDRQQSETKSGEETTKSTDNLTNNNNLIFALPKLCKSQRTEAENQLLLYPKTKLVEIFAKIDEEHARNLQEEGFYVPEEPKIPLKHKNFMEQRLILDDKKWFNCEGKLEMMENPTQKTSYRPILKHSRNDEISTYQPPIINPQAECEEIVISGDKILQLKIASLKFNHHPLFSLEHVFSEKLISLCEEHNENINRNNVTRLQHHLDGIRSIVKRTKGDAYRRDIKTLRKQLFEEGKQERDRIKLILQTWKSLKRIRTLNNYSNTSTKLHIRKEETDYASDKIKFETNVEQTVKEMLEEQAKRSKKYSEEDIREEVLQCFEESFRMPGEPILHFTLTNDNNISLEIENSKEMARRNVVNTSKICLKIICNKIQVCKTKYVGFSEDFCCYFDEIITIQLSTIPKFLTIEVIEQPKALTKRTVGEILINLPWQHQSVHDRVRFEKEDIIHYKHEGVGSGVKIGDLIKNLDLMADDNFELKTSGTLTYSLKWMKTTPDQEKKNNDEAIIWEIIDKYGSINLEKLSEWMEQKQPDPQDPKNTILYEYSLENQEMPVKNNYFRLSPHMKNWQFCQPKMLENNIRLKILQLRNRNEPEFDRMTVPNRIKEIPFDILADYNRRIATENDPEEIELENEIQQRRSNGKKLLRQIQIKVFQKCKNSQNNLTFEDVIDEKFMHHFEKIIKVMVHNLINWFQWRPLKPHLPQQEIKLTQQSNDHQMSSQARIVIKIISALNLPERLDKSEINPFVEVEYNNITVKTLTNQGSHPNWNEELNIPLESSHSDYLNPNSLNGTILVNIFDETDEVLTKFGGVKARNWLGFLEIPLSAICWQGIQGMFRVKKPHLALGYKETDLQIAKTSRNNSQIHQKMYINMQISVEPNIPKLHPTIEEMPCSELPYIREHALKWNENYNLNFPNRKFSVFAIDTNATTTCIVRYIKPLEPPQINAEGFDVTPEQCARYISQIPFTDCNEFYKIIWLPVDRFLSYMIGSIVDHAIALTCYFLALKMETWLLFGYGIPYGSTAFVLVKEYDSNHAPIFYIYDVVEGEKIFFTDIFCPLQRIYCIINEHNVWANTQRNDDIALIRFDLSRKADWLPLFNSKIPAPTTSIHGKLFYGPKAELDELEIIIDRKIRKKIAKLRQLDRTIWHHNISNSFKNILASFETNMMYGKNISEAFEQIRSFMRSYHIRGHILNLPFTSISSLIKRVKAFGLHLAEGDNVQFASAVCLKGYSNQVLTLWVFLATVLQKPQNVNDND